MGLIKPKKLKQGDTIGVVAPSGFWDRIEIDKAAENLKTFGYNVVVHPQCYERDFVSAGSCVQRLDALHDFFADDKIDAIFAMRGGLRSIQLLDKIDYDMVAKNPKIFIGYSDTTFLLSALNARSNMVTFHGLSLSGYLPNKPRDDQQKTLAFLEGGDFPWDNAGDVLNPGQAEGVLVGGNLSLVMASLAAKESIGFDLENKILMIEDIGEEIRQIDRMMATLELAGVFKKMAGLIVGQLSDVRDTGEYFKFNRTARDIVADYVGKWDKPVAFDAPFGHDQPNLPFPLGVRAKLTAAGKGNASLQLLESPFADA